MCLGDTSYALYVPAKLTRGMPRPTWEWAMENVPVACQATEGRVLRARLEKNRRKDQPPIHFAVEADSYIAIIRLLASETIAAILPIFVCEELAPDKYLKITNPELNHFGRPGWLLWNERMIKRRGERAATLRDQLTTLLACPPPVAPRSSGTMIRPSQPGTEI